MRRLLKKINLVLKLLNKHRITAIFFLIGYKPGKLHFLLQNFQLYHLVDQKVYENASLKQWQGESYFSAVAVMEQEHHVLFCPLLKLPSRMVLLLKIISDVFLKKPLILKLRMTGKNFSPGLLTLFRPPAKYKVMKSCNHV
ncbi:hypothetical protein TRBR_04210 [Treponema bryantii]|nr:hypothetical protein TRBR_04210 [Treponema bryantii]